MQTDQNSANAQPPVPTCLSNTTQVPQIMRGVTPTQHEYDAPEILTQPKKEWHYRNMKDLGKNRIPLLAGDGPQRTLIRVKVKYCFYSMKIEVENKTHTILRFLRKALLRCIWVLSFKLMTIENIVRKYLFQNIQVLI
jgi:hypothetical protein